MEKEIFESLSEQGLGPKLYFQNSEYRIEGFFLSRPLTIFEMSNPIFLDAYGEKICDFNYNPKLRERVLKYLPMDKLYVDRVIQEWHPEVVGRLPIIREKYAGQENILRIIKEFEDTFLFPGAPEHFEKLLPRDSEIVLAHNDA